MSNPLFASHMMQMAYLCKPGKPNELLACYPFSTFAYDISKYNLGFPEGYVNSSWAAHNTEHPYPVDNPWPIIKSASYIGITYPCHHLDLSKSWSLDGFIMKMDNRCDSRIIVGDLIFSSGFGSHSGYNNLGVWWNDTQISALNNFLPGYFAATYDAQNATIRTYVNGVLYSSVQQSLSGTVNTIAIRDNHGNSLTSFGNFRVVQKRLGTNSTYPNQAALYTGYEAL